jgi:hypothetical protein
MREDTALTFVFRRPVFPVLVDVNGHVLVARTGPALLRKLVPFDLVPRNSFNAVDAAGEGWGGDIVEDGIIVSPLVWKKTWTKLELIRLCNGRKNRPSHEEPYPETSLSSKKLTKVIADLAHRISEAERRK